MNKFWNINTTAKELYIYGDITSGEKWHDSDTTAKTFVEDLNALGGVATIRICSGGGDIFAALAIGSIVAERGLTVQIDGLAASAAMLIVASSPHVKAASNSLLMIHQSSVTLWDTYDAADLAKAQAALAAVESSIVATLSKRCKNVEPLLQAETWLTATEARDLGFIDELIDEVSLTMNDSAQMLFVNSLAVSTSHFDRNKMAKVINMSIDKKYLDSVRSAELGRIKALMTLKGKNAASDAIINVALKRGHSVEDVKPYLDALADIKTTDATAAIVNVIADNMTSGAEGVTGGSIDLKAAQANKIIEYANAMR